PQQRRGAVRAIDLPAGLAQRFEDKGALVLFQITEGSGGRFRRDLSVTWGAGDGATGGTEGEIEITVPRADDRAFDHVLEFAHVARPVVGVQFLKMGGGEGRCGPAELARGLLEEMLG